MMDVVKVCVLYVLYLMVIVLVQYDVRYMIQILYGGKSVYILQNDTEQY